ncbi:2Fe-2S iron-sulfur cluster binding domain-containing protein [Candidatus Poribacteria bacterium]|nr:2Fe-2S iron-sulfur cluster binding domain-containing protein [Candidatus Poribacteria bacterium]
MGEVELTLNGVYVKGSEGMTILELAEENGIEIPTLCYLSDLTPTGSCRICVVEVKGSRTLVASCHTPISRGMDVQTHSPKVIKARKAILELVFADHSGDCLMCDKANICDLRKIAADLGMTLTRAKGKKHYYVPDEINPYIVRDMTKCIMCRRCVRACRELKEEGVLGIVGRGFDSNVTVDTDQALEDVCKSCDVCVEVCPVGALTKKEEQFAGKKKGKPLLITG